MNRSIGLRSQSAQSADPDVWQVGNGRFANRLERPESAVGVGELRSRWIGHGGAEGAWAARSRSGQGAPRETQRVRMATLAGSSLPFGGISSPS